MPPRIKKTNTLRNPYADDDDGDDLVYDPETLPSILPPKVKKVKGPKSLPPPKPTKRSKSAARKIAKLEEEKAKKLKRGELYASLAATAIPEEHLRLLQRSGSAIGVASLTAKQQMQREADFKSAGLSFAPSGKSSSSDDYVNTQPMEVEEKEEEGEEEENVLNSTFAHGYGKRHQPEKKGSVSTSLISHGSSEQGEQVGSKKRKRVVSESEVVKEKVDLSSLPSVLLSSKKRDDKVRKGKGDVIANHDDNDDDYDLQPENRKKAKKTVRWNLQEDDDQKNDEEENEEENEKEEEEEEDDLDTDDEEDEEDEDEEEFSDEDDDEEEEEEEIQRVPLVIPPSNFSFSIKLPTSTTSSKAPSAVKTEGVNSEQPSSSNEQSGKMSFTLKEQQSSHSNYHIDDDEEEEDAGDEISRSVSSSAAAKRAAQLDPSEVRLAELRARNKALSDRGLTAADLLPKLRGGVTEDYASGDVQKRVARNYTANKGGEGEMDITENDDDKEDDDDVDDDEEEEKDEDMAELLAEVTEKAVTAARLRDAENDETDGPHVASATKNWWDPSSYVSASSTSEQQALSAAITAGVVEKGAFGLLTEEEVRERISANNDDLRSQLWMADGSKVLGVHHKQALAAWSAYGRSSNRLKRDPRVQEARMELPVCRMEQEIMEALHSSDVLILCGETGSGKTTQVPQFLLEAGYGSLNKEVKIASKHSLSTLSSSSSSSSFSSSSLISSPPPPHLYEGFPGLIGVTQPRRVAATSTADRVRSELSADPDLARSIAHQVRHDARGVTSTTKLKFMTDGILMREVQTDLLLRKYSVIVIDEAHERNVNTDVLIGILSRVIPLRNKIAKEEADALRARQEKEISNSNEALRLPLPGEEGAPLGPLKLIIMSATLRVDDFAANIKLFPSRPPVVKVEARQHPVTIHFAKQTSPDGDYVSEALKKACKVHSRLPEGGLLIFLSGSDEVEYLCGELRKKYGSKKAAALSAEKEVQETSQAAYDAAVAAAKIAGLEDEAATVAGEEAKAASEELVKKRQRKASGGGTGGGLGPAFVLPLYALLPAAQQSRVFDTPPEGYRLIVVATNVAETSITIPGIRYVIDPGRRKRRVFDPRSGASRFEIGWISQAGASQRSGRAGRTGPGHVYRLYSSALFANTFQEFDDPEILRTPVESLLLQLTKLGISQPSLFPFPSPPSQSALTAGRRTLLNLGALQVSSSSPMPGGQNHSIEKLTALGEKIAGIPLSPHLAKMLIIAWMRQEAARKEGNASNAAWNLLDYTLQIVAAMSAQTPFVLPSLKDDDEISSVGAGTDGKRKRGGGGRAGGAFRTDTVPNEDKKNKKENNDDDDDDDIDISTAGSDEEGDGDGDDDNSRMRRGRGVDTIAEKAAIEAGIDLKLLSPEDRAATVADITAQKQAEAEAAERRRLERVRVRNEAHRAHARMRHPLSDSLTLLRAMGAFNFAVNSAASIQKEMKKKKMEGGGGGEEIITESHAASEFCKSQYLRLKSMKEALQLERQLRRTFFTAITPITSSSLKDNDDDDNNDEGAGGGDAAEDEEEEEKKQNSSTSSSSSSPLLPPPSVETETLLRQVVTSGLLERVAKRAPPELVESLCAAAQVGKGRAWVPYLPASEAVSCGFIGEEESSSSNTGSGGLGKVLFVHPSSAVDEADARIMPAFVCFTEVIVSGRRQRAYMRGVSAVDESWLHPLSAGSPFCKLSAPLETPQPAYSLRADDTLCLRVPIFGDGPWRLTPVPLPLVLPRHAAALVGASASEESSIEARVTREAIRVKCFARALLDGTIIKQIKKEMLASSPISITQNAPQKRVALLIDALTRGCAANGGKSIATLAGLVEAWTPKKKNKDGGVSRYLFPEIGAWIVSSEADSFLKMWPNIVKEIIGVA